MEYTAFMRPKYEERDLQRASSKQNPTAKGIIIKKKESEGNASAQRINNAISIDGLPAMFINEIVALYPQHAFSLMILPFAYIGANMNALKQPQ